MGNTPGTADRPEVSAGFYLGVPVEKPVESVNNFLYI